MDSKDRVQAALQGEFADRRPCTVMLSLYGARLTDCPLEQYYTDPYAYARGQAKALETFGPDILFAPFFCAGEGEAFGAELEFFDDQPPNLRRPAITSAQDISRLSAPDVDAHPTLAYVRQALREIASAHGKRVTIAAVVLNPLDLPLMIMGIENWLQIVLFDQDGTRRMLDLTMPFFNEYANALLADGADVLVIPTSFLSPVIVTPEIAEGVTRPVLQEAFASVQGPIIVHHAGGSFIKFLALGVELPNVVGFVLGHQDDLGLARDIVGPNLALLGGLDAPNIGQVLPRQVQARCTELLQDRRDDPRFILATGGPDVAFDTPRENIAAIRQAVEVLYNV